MAEETKKETKTTENKVAIRVEKVYENAPLPVKPGVKTDAGYDVFAHNVSRIYAHFGSNGETLLEGDNLESKFVEPGVFELQSGERALIGTGLKMTIGEGWEIQVRPRSGNALKRGLTVVNTPGTIDEAFRGEVGVIIMNTSRKTQRITLGEAIAQIVPKRVENLEIIEEKLNDNTARGSNGYGSTSKKDFNSNVIEPLPMNPTFKTTPFNMM